MLDHDPLKVLMADLAEREIEIRHVIMLSRNRWRGE